MKTLKIKHKSGKKIHLYSFILFEQSKTVRVDKGSELDAYRLLHNGKGWDCSCWGHQRWKRCWHRLEALPKLLKQPSQDDFEAEIMEEAMQIEMDKRDHPEERRGKIYE